MATKRPDPITPGEISSLPLLLCLAQRVKRLSGSTDELASSTL